MKSKNITIDGISCKLFKFTPSQGLPILARLQKMIGGSIVDLIEAAENIDNAYSVIGGAIDKLSDRNDPAEVQSLINDVLTGGSVIVKGKKLEHLDDLAQHEDDTDPMYLMISLFKEQVSYSFSNFLSKMVGNLPSLEAQTEQKT